MLGLDQLYKSPKEGGIGLLDLKSRNQAIEVTWLRSFAATGPRRPSWAFVADTLINNLRPQGISSPEELGGFLQSWSPPTQGARANMLPPEILRLLKTAKRHNMTFAPINLSEDLKLTLPSWFHIGAPPSTYHKSRDECLKSNHHSASVGSLLKISRRLDNPPNPHSSRRNCKCRDCKDDRARGCANPHKCATTALGIIDSINPKLSPTNNPIHDDLTLTHTRREKNQQAIKTGQGEILFDPSVTTKTSLDDCFRVFGPNGHHQGEPAWRPQRLPRGGIRIQEATRAWTEGSCQNNRRQNARCGSGVWYGQGDRRNTSARIPGLAQSNQAGELAAVIIAAQQCDPFTQLSITTDSKYVISGLTEHVNAWEDCGWIGIENRDLFEAAVYQLRKRAVTHQKCLVART
ncbi:hypothetical protein BJ138DRAFT_1113526 [Hygrophoropsis aurantiaca]|uniref:Uncharacterized protein n=1 Tax=Hygrophoropsis aurantiaca TaxID=72124 RepID=A0ACB8AD35_9AGAM|nr:hypothetical protein BJ138DRAFT_1113526 [Hygrophoropsis aurantiaca]